jgi:ribose-phosphate pyrophosphokinase
MSFPAPNVAHRDASFDGSLPTSPTVGQPRAAVTRVPYRIHLVAGRGNPKLAQQISFCLKLPLTPCHISNKPSGEINIKVDPTVRGGDVYVVQPMCASAASADVNTALLELMFMVRRLRLAQAARVTAIVPFFAYARQDRKTDLRGPISASAVALLIDRMGIDRIATLDLHSGQIQGFFNNRAPMDNLNMSHEFARYVGAQAWFDKARTVIVSPDAGGVGRAHEFADVLGVSHVVTITKRRVEAGKVESMETVGDVAGFTCIIYDDMVDTGGTLIKACELLKSMGALKVVACISHGILSGPCAARINASDALEELVVSNSLPQDANLTRVTEGKLKVLCVANILATAVLCYHAERSVSNLFRGPSTPPPMDSLPGYVKPAPAAQ